MSRIRRYSLSSRVGGLKAREAVKLLTYAERALIIQHIDKAVPITSPPNAPSAFLSLRRAQILTDQHAGRRARHSRLTEFGRDVSAALLADYAEGLIAAGFTPTKWARHLNGRQQREPIRLAPTDAEPLQLTET